jgi:tight adherence protein B
MPLPALAAVFFTLFGALVLASVFAGRRALRSQVERRVSLVAEVKEKPLASAQPKAAVNRKSAEYIKAFFTFGGGYSWGMTASAAYLAIVSAICAAAAWILARSMLDLPVLLVLPGCAGLSLLAPRYILYIQQQRAKREFTGLFPDAVDMIARILRAGMPITYAIQVVGNEAPAPVNKVFEMIADQIKIGIPVAAALDTASQQVGLPDFRFFAMSAIMQFSTGGNLITTLEDLTEIMRKRKAGRLKAKAVTAEIRFSAYVLGALPVFIFAALFLMEPDYLTPLFTDRRGNYILALAGGGLFLSFLTMRHLVRSVDHE